MKKTMKKNVLMASLLFASSLALLAGCSNEDLSGNDAGPDTPIGRQVTATANIGAPDTRVSFEPNESGGLKTAWDTGDTFTVITPNGYKGAIFTLSGEGGSADGIFTGELTDEFAGLVGALYPAIPVADLSTSGEQTINIKEQSGKLDGTLPAYMVGTATYTVDEVLAFSKFTPMTSIVEITMTGIPDGVTFEKVTLSGKNLLDKIDFTLSRFTVLIDWERIGEFSATGSFTKIANKAYFSVFGSNSPRSVSEAKVVATTTDNKQYEAALADFPSGVRKGQFYTVEAQMQEVVTPYGWYQKGSESSQFEISNAAELKEFALLVNGDSEAMNKAGADVRPDFAGVTVTQTRDIDLGTNVEWAPIGNSDSHAFKGTFDGNGKKVTGSLIPSLPERGYRFGIFGYIENATIKNVHFEGTMLVERMVLDDYCSYNMGSIVGEAVGSTIINCSNTTDLKPTAEGINLGGIVGIARDESKVIACVNSGSIKGNALVGGIAGEADIVMGCINKGSSIIADGPAYYGVGGICASVNQDVKACWSIADEIIHNTGDKMRWGALIGGFSMSNDNSKMTDCYWKLMTGSGSDLSAIGENQVGRIENCSSFTAVPTAPQIEAMNNTWNAADPSREYQFNAATGEIEKK